MNNTADTRQRAPEFDPDELEHISDELLAKRLEYNRRNRGRSEHAPISREWYDRLIAELETEERRRRAVATPEDRATMEHWDRLGMGPELVAFRKRNGLPIRIR